LDVNRKILAEAREKDVEPQLNLKPLVNETGFYELVAVITHKGLSADGGHYVSWIKDDANNRWLLFDDDRESECTEEDVRKLDGKQSGTKNNNHHCLIYGTHLLLHKQHNGTWLIFCYTALKRTSLRRNNALMRN